ncbi:AhpC/TSA family protein [Hymenobacter profundi]|uniref:AhpC/TSA family protein n=1 Tax=Hymenobacter profundi TaxID=1982110 RepID=A0ABS6WZA9_9BACT|nr:AhpC/TSA family protein [Hymenobacter profundi]MBW3128937.1 AhpC/TSA family protein [Hymenobacter profundi]
MKKHLLGLLLLAPWLAQAQTPTPYTLKGKIGKLSAPAKVYMLRDGKFTDSTALTNGAFELKGTVEAPQQVMLVLARDGKLKQTLANFMKADRTTLFLEKGPVMLTSADSLTTAKITGSKLTAEHQKLQATLKPANDKMKALMVDYRAASPEQRKDPAFMKQLDEREEAISAESKQHYLAFVKANPNSPVSLGAVKQVGGSVPSYAEVAPLYESLAPAVKNSPEGKKYGEMLQAIKAVSIGATAPNFTQQTPDGKQVSLADYRGKYVLIDFWASWCGPCRQENPNVTKVYNDYKTKNFDILGVSLDNEKAREKWLKAIADDQLAWTQVSDLKGWQNDVAVQYHVQAIPQNFLVDPTGKIVATNLRGDDLRATLAKYIK